MTSPPYPLAQPRAYGQPSASGFVDFVCRALEPIVERLRRGGSLVINVSNDIFRQGSPARSLYRHHLVVALEQRLGLQLMDEVIWRNPSKPPGPTQWACKRRQQLTCGYEPVLWLCNDPPACLSDNRRVLAEHTERHTRLIQGGGEDRERGFADGAHRLRSGDFGGATGGRIPSNVISLGHACSGARQVNAYCDAHGLARHGAMFPERLVAFFVELLSRVDDLVVDPFAGTATVASVAERMGRRWVATDLVCEYLQAAGGARFSPTSTWFNPALFERVGDHQVRPVAELA